MPSQLNNNIFKDYGESNNLPFSRALYNYSVLVSSSISVIVIIYFCYKGFKDFGNRNTKNFLILGICLTAILCLSLGGLFYLINSWNTEQTSFSNGMNVEYGAFLMMISIILFFFLHFKQDYILNSEKIT